MLANELHKKATKAALGLLVGTRGHTARYAAMVVQDAQESLGLEPGDMASMEAKANYACGILQKGEKTSNRNWEDYPSAVRDLAHKIADTGEEAFNGVYFA